MSNTCPVCGYPDLVDPPRSKSGGVSYEYCPSCRFHFGYTDDALHLTYEQWRAQWVAQGMPWNSKSIKFPLNWNAKDQLLNIGVKLPEGSQAINNMDANSNTKLIYIRLLNEGTEVSRPTRALDLGNGLFKVLPTSNYDADDETWEFLPGSVVQCEKRIGSQGEHLLAIKAD